MSLCPNNDLHSVYLDGELPEQFKAEYENHVNNCPACQSELKKLSALRSVFASDAKTVTPDSHYLDESFARLQIKMSYSKNTVHHKPSNNIKNFSYVAMAAAAAVAFAFIVPLRINAGKNSASGANTAVASVPSFSSMPAYGTSVNNVSLNSGRSVVISGNIEGAVIPSVSSDVSSNVSMNNNTYSGHHHNPRSRYGSMIADVEMFRPDFGEPASISIKVTFPGMGAGPIPSDLPLPENVITGNGE